MAIIGVDFDNVIVDYSHALALVVAQARRQCPSEYKTPSSWTFQDWGLNDQAFSLYHSVLLTSRNSLITPIAGAISKLHLWRKKGHKIHIITHRGANPLRSVAFKISEMRATIESIKTLKIPYDALTFTYEKWKVDCDYYIDDSPKVIEEYINHGKKYFIYPYKYNNHLPGNRFVWL